MHHVWPSHQMCALFLSQARMLAKKPGSVVRSIRQVDEMHHMTAGCSEQFGGSALSGAEYVANAAYMAPETIRAIQGCPLPNEPAVSTAADIFSLGALLKAVLLVGGPTQACLQVALHVG